MNENEYVSDVIDIYSMSIEQERDMFAAIRHGDKLTKDRLIQGGLTVARQIADRFVSSQASFDELFSEAIVALNEAVHNYDHTVDGRFAQYLAKLIDVSMQNYYSNLTWLLPIEPRFVRLHDKYEAALLELYPKIKDRESDAVQDEGYVADRLGVSVDELRTMKAEYRMCLNESLEQLAELENTTDGSPHDVVFDPRDNNAANYLDDLMDCLEEHERYVVCATNGVLCVMERPHEYIAFKLGIEQDQVDVIYRRAIDKLRKAHV